MKNLHFFVFLFIALTISYSPLQAQGLGWIPDKVAYQHTELAVVYGGGSKADNIQTVVTKIKKSCPTPSNQEKKPSCVAEAICNALTAQKAVAAGLTKKEEINAMRFSPSYLYHQIKTENCSRGTIFEQVLDTLKSQGVCTLSQFNPSTCETIPNATHKELAKKNRLATYQRLFDYSSSSDVNKIYPIQAALSNNLPVVAGFHLDASFFKTIKPGTTFWNPEKLDYSGDYQHSYHAMVVVGYDNNRNAFEIMNSWGEGWANNGFIWISYDVFKKVCECAYVLTPINIDENKNISLAGKFGLRTNEGFDWDKNVPIFKKQRIKYKANGVYTPENPDWKVNATYQLTASVQKACHIYVFSKNPSGKVVLNYPTKDARIVVSSSGGSQYGVENVSLLPSLQSIPNCEIVIPDSLTAMKLVEIGEDQSCILFSSEEIKNIREVRETLDNMSGSLEERIKKHFGKAIIPTSEIKYEEGEEMKFISNSQSGGYIVPIYLNITAK